MPDTKMKNVNASNLATFANCLKTKFETNEFTLHNKDLTVDMNYQKSGQLKFTNADNGPGGTYSTVALKVMPNATGNHFEFTHKLQVPSLYVTGTTQLTLEDTSSNVYTAVMKDANGVLYSCPMLQRTPIGISMTGSTTINTLVVSTTASVTSNLSSGGTVTFSGLSTSSTQEHRLVGVTNTGALVKLPIHYSGIPTSRYFGVDSDVIKLGTDTSSKAEIKVTDKTNLSTTSLVTMKDCYLTDAVYDSYTVRGMLNLILSQLYTKLDFTFDVDTLTSRYLKISYFRLESGSNAPTMMEDNTTSGVQRITFTDQNAFIVFENPNLSSSYSSTALLLLESITNTEIALGGSTSGGFALKPIDNTTLRDSTAKFKVTGIHANNKLGNIVIKGTVTGYLRFLPNSGLSTSQYDTIHNSVGYISQGRGDLKGNTGVSIQGSFRVQDYQY